MGAAESKLPSHEAEPLNFDGLDFYEILGVSREFSDEELKQAYRARAKQTHPDKDHTAGATERFKKVLEAYDTLKTPESRILYDNRRQKEEKWNSDLGAYAHARSHQRQNASMPGQWGAEPQPQDTQPPSPGWFGWFFSTWAPRDPLLRYVPEEYIAQNRNRACPQGMSAKDIYDYFKVCFEEKNTTWEENGRDKSLYTLIRNLFECLAYDERMWGNNDAIPDFGCDNSAWCFDDDPSAAHWVVGFYRYWLNFETKKKFDWVNPYQTAVDDRRMRRQVAIENAKIHGKCREQYNDIVRTIVEALLQGDPRCIRHLVIRAYRDGDLVSMDTFCHQFIKKNSHRRGQPNSSESNANNGGRGGQNTQTRNRKKKQRRRNKGY